jgi:hypothetical protein
VLAFGFANHVVVVYVPPTKHMSQSGAGEPATEKYLAAWAPGLAKETGALNADVNPIVWRRDRWKKKSIVTLKMQETRLARRVAFQGQIGLVVHRSMAQVLEAACSWAQGIRDTRLKGLGAL